METEPKQKPREERRMEMDNELETVLRHLRVQYGTIQVYSELMKQMEQEYGILQQIFGPEMVRRPPMEYSATMQDNDVFYHEYLRASAEAAQQVLNEVGHTNGELFECDQSEISCDTYEVNELQVNEEEQMNIVDEEEQEIKIVETEMETKKTNKNSTVNVVKEKGKKIKKKL